MASELKVDKFTGVTTAGSIDVTGEGNSTTTNLQQGLAKSFCKFGVDAVADDSLNISSTTDVATGKWRFVKSNAMGSTDYMVVVASGHSISAFATGFDTGAVESTTDHIQAKYDSDFQDFHSGTGYGMHVIHGDLA
tara:strand:- start:1103 stop:1510 length:408 start_codon:yes stop_codon:yes gene_type:complete